MSRIKKIKHKTIKEIDKTSEAYIQNAESALANIRETEANLQERERQIQIHEAKIKWGLEQLQMRLSAQQGIPLNPMQSSSAMDVPQYPIQYPIQLQFPSGASGSMIGPQYQMPALDIPPITRVKRQSLALADKPASSASASAAASASASAAASAEEANPEMAGTNLIKQSDSKWSRAALPTLQRQLQLRGVSLELIARKPREQLIAMILQRDDR